VGQNTTVVGLGEVRIELDSFVKVRDGAVEIAAEVVSKPALAVGPSEVRLERNGLGEIGNGVGRVSNLPKR